MPSMRYCYYENPPGVSEGVEDVGEDVRLVEDHGGGEVEDWGGH